MNRALRTFGVLTAGLLLVGGLAHTPAVADEATPDPAAPTVAVGACHDLTLAQISEHSIPVEPVDCAVAHTARVIAVATLPAELTWASPASRIQATASATCMSALGKLVGTNPLLQARAQYTIAWYQPSDAQVAAGARWYTCHVIVPQDDRLADLPDTLPRLSKKTPDSVARCAAARTMAFTTCADKHAWRTTYSFYVNKKPSEKNGIAAARAVCPRHVPNVRKSIYSWHPVSAKKFVTVCYAKTKR